MADLTTHPSKEAEQSAEKLAAVDVLTEARRVLKIEVEGLIDLMERLDENFEKALEMILECKGKVVLCGMGKSGLIARKIASTLSSTGTPAVFVHPAESSHGDLGVISSGDVVIGISYSGETAELHHLLRYLNRKNIPLIAISGNPASSLGKASAVHLSVHVRQEACPMGLAPTASTTATLALGDALAVAALQKRGFKPEDFAEFHPGGSLGQKLLTRVSDVMHSGDALPLVNRTTPLKEVIFKMTAKEVRGVAGVLDEKGDLVGVITDGNIRRRLDKDLNIANDKAMDVMSPSPKIIDAHELAEKALFMMEEFSIQVLFVVDRKSASAKRPVGILHIQDLLKSKVR